MIYLIIFGFICILLNYFNAKMILKYSKEYWIMYLRQVDRSSHFGLLSVGALGLRCVCIGFVLYAASITRKSALLCWFDVVPFQLNISYSVSHTNGLPLGPLGISLLPP